MQLLVNERVRVFGERHRVIDSLRSQRESGGALAVEPEALHALLQEIDLLQVVAHTAEHVAGFPPGARGGEPLAHLRNALRRWKE